MADERRMTVVRLAGALAVAAVVGCSGGDGGAGVAGAAGMGGAAGMAGKTGGTAGSSAPGGAGGGPIPFSDFEPTAISSLCRLLVFCNDLPDMASCLASEQVEPHYYATLGMDIPAGKVLYDGAKARTCIDALNAVSTCSRSDPFSVLGPSCAIFTGTVAAGGACFVDAECADGGSCQSTEPSCDSFAQCCPGTCLALPAQTPEGGDCSGSHAPCSPGTTCTTDSTGTTATCLGLPSTPGADCSATMLCQPPLYCDSATDTCKAPVATGGACNPSLQSIDCADGRDQCDPVSSSCTRLLALGAACGSSTGGCVGYASCDPTSSTCVELPGVGQSCDPTNGSPCLGGATCDTTSSTCLLVPEGGACS